MTCVEFWHQSATDIDEENKDDGNLASESPAGHAIDDVRDGKQELEAGPTAKRKRVADSESLSSMKKRLTAANAAKKIETDGKINLTDQNTPIGQLALLCTGKYIFSERTDDRIYSPHWIGSSAPAIETHNLRFFKQINLHQQTKNSGPFTYLYLQHKEFSNRVYIVWMRHLTGR